MHIQICRCLQMDWTDQETLLLLVQCLMVHDSMFFSRPGSTSSKFVWPVSPATVIPFLEHTFQQFQSYLGWGMHNLPPLHLHTVHSPLILSRFLHTLRAWYYDNCWPHKHISFYVHCWPDKHISFRWIKTGPICWANARVIAQIWFENIQIK